MAFPPYFTTKTSPGAGCLAEGLAKLFILCINIQEMTAIAPAPVGSLRGRSLLRLSDLASNELDEIVRLAAYLKSHRLGDRLPLLAGKTLAMLFEKPSLRTRVSFEVAMNQ